MFLHSSRFELVFVALPQVPIDWKAIGDKEAKETQNERVARHSVPRLVVDFAASGAGNDI